MSFPASLRFILISKLFLELSISTYERYPSVEYGGGVKVHCGVEIDPVETFNPLFTAKW